MRESLCACVCVWMCVSVCLCVGLCIKFRCSQSQRLWILWNWSCRQLSSAWHGCWEPVLGFLLLCYNTRTKSNLGTKGFISVFNSQVTFHHQANSGQDLEAGTETDAMEECCSLVCSPRLARPLSHSTQGHQPRGGTTSVGWAIHISHQWKKNALQARWQANLPEDFLKWGCSSPVTLAYVKLTEH